MWLNRSDNNKVINKPIALTINGIQYPANIFTKWTEEQLTEIGLPTIVATGTHDRRYYTNVKVEDFDATPPTISYVAVEKLLADVQATLIASVEETANEKFNEATSGYTSGEMSSWNELESDARDHQETPLLSGMLYDEASIAGITVDVLASKVITNALMFKQVKSFISGTRKKKITEIGLFTTLLECMTYEKEPYDYTLTEEDVVDEMSEGIVGNIVVRYKNNVTDWS